MPWSFLPLVFLAMCVWPVGTVGLLRGEKNKKKVDLVLLLFFSAPLPVSILKGVAKINGFTPSPSRQPKWTIFLNLVFESSPPLLLLLLLSSSSVGREIFDLKFYRKYQRKLGSFTCKLKCDSEIREVSRWNTEETKCVFCFFYRRRISDEL